MGAQSRVFGQAAGLAAIAALGMSWGCGGGSLCSGGAAPNDLALVRTAQAGRVVLPAGFGGSPSALRVGTSAGTTSVDANADFVCPTFVGGSHLALVFSPNGKPMLMGWLDASRPEISARTTADVLLYYALAGQWLAGEQRSKLIGLIAERPEVQPLADAIAAAVASDPDALFDGRASVATHLRTAKNALIGSVSGKTTGRGRDVLIDPSTSKSGLTLIQDAGAINSVSMVNRYRRRSYAFVDRVSYTIAGVGSDVTFPSPASVTGFDIEPINGVSTILGTITDMFYGNMAYQEKATNKIQLSLTPDNAKKTTYEVTVVGWGREQGDFARLTSAQRSKYGDMVARSLVCDFFLPLLLNAIIPAGSNKLDDMLNFTAGSEAVKDFVAALTQNAPGIWQKAEAGDMEGAVWDAYQAVQTSNFLKPLLLQLIMNAIKDNGQALAFGEVAQKFLNVLTAGDAFLTGFDALVQSAHYAGSNRADIWKVDISAPNLRLQPDPAVVTAGLDTDIAIW
ncbi:MAG: hypothetical protein FJX72_15010, partial [Armatimonadetes bacterium]|nr:hypothetical protein [Armatimonadota bacterium]